MNQMHAEKTRATRPYRLVSKDVKTVCGKKIRDHWTPLRPVGMKSGETWSIVEVEAPCKTRFEVLSKDIILFPDIVTTTEDFGGHEACTTFDIDFATPLEPGFVSVRCRQRGVSMLLPADIVEPAVRHLPEKDSLAV